MTKLNIWNRALALLPHDRRVTAADEASETPTTECLRCRDHWDAARQAVLAAHDWGWATMQTDVCGGCPSGHGTLRFGFARPAGAMRIVGVFNARGRRVRADAFNGLIATDAPECFLRYIPDIDDTTAWPSWFSDAVVAELARRVAPEITANAQTERRLSGLAIEKLNEAIRIDAAEARFGGTDGRTFVRARNTGGGGPKWRRG